MVVALMDWIVCRVWPSVFRCRWRCVRVCVCYGVWPLWGTGSNEYCLNFFTVRSTQYSGLILGVYVIWYMHTHTRSICILEYGTHTRSICHTCILEYSVSDVGKICIYVVASVRASVTEYDHSGVLHYLRIVLNCTNSNYGASPGLSTESKQ